MDGGETVLIPSLNFRNELSADSDSGYVSVAVVGRCSGKDEEWGWMSLIWLLQESPPHRR